MCDEAKAGLIIFGCFVFAVSLFAIGVSLSEHRKEQHELEMAKLGYVQVRDAGGWYSWKKVEDAK